MSSPHRSGRRALGLMLTSVTMAGRVRVLALLPTGEIWVVSPSDVQFVLPGSLVPEHVVKACWSLKQFQAWSRGEDILDEVSDEGSAISSARWAAADSLRSVQRQAEKMCNKLMNCTAARTSTDSLWEAFSSMESRASLTCSEAAEWLLRRHEPGESYHSPAASLPSYAAFILMMNRPDLFFADPLDMWRTGRFLVRSGQERSSYSTVGDAISMTPSEHKLNDEETLQIEAGFESFVGKAKVLLQKAKDMRENPSTRLTRVESELLWNDQDQAILSQLLQNVFEGRSTQISPARSLTARIVKALDYSRIGDVNYAFVAALLTDLGVVAPFDSLSIAKSVEACDRAMASASKRPSSRLKTDILQGDELDNAVHDFSSHKVYVIDDGHAKELDDGISVERIRESTDLWIHVHIADPTRYLTPDHAWAEAASHRGDSVYVPEGSLPMFPDPSISDFAGLGSTSHTGKGQTVLTFSARITADGETVDYEVRLGCINKPRLVSYNAVDRMLDTASQGASQPFGRHPRVGEAKETDEGDTEDLKLLTEMATRVRARRLSDAGLDWYFALSEIALDCPSPATSIFNPAGIPRSSVLWSGPIPLHFWVPTGTRPVMNAKGMVAEMMIIAGRTAARFTQERNIPVMYRTSPPPSTPMGVRTTALEELLALREPGTGRIDPSAVQASSLFFGMAETSLTPSQHWIMGITQGGYLKVTSPLRRYDDLLVHWQIKAALAQAKGITPPTRMMDAEQISRLTKRALQGQRRTADITRRAEEWWRCAVLLDQIAITEGQSSRFDYGQRPEKPVDLTRLRARVAGQPLSMPDGVTSITPILLEELGIVATLKSARRTPGPGERMEVALSAVKQSPNLEVQVQEV